MRSPQWRKLSARAEPPAGTPLAAASGSDGGALPDVEVLAVVLIRYRAPPAELAPVEPLEGGDSAHVVGKHHGHRHKPARPGTRRCGVSNVAPVLCGRDHKEPLHLFRLSYLLYGLSGPREERHQKSRSKTRGRTFHHRVPEDSGPWIPPSLVGAPARSKSRASVSERAEDPGLHCHVTHVMVTAAK